MKFILLILKEDLYFTDFRRYNLYQPPLVEALEMVSNDKRPLKIINAYENQICINYET